MFGTGRFSKPWKKGKALAQKVPHIGKILILPPKTSRYNSDSLFGQNISGFFGEFGGVDVEPCRLKVDSVLHDLTDGMGESGREFKIGRRRLAGELFNE